MDSLNNVASSTFLPRKSWDDLAQDQSYMVTEIKKLNTKYGKRMVFIINQALGQFQIFVPTRVSNTLYEDDKLYYKLAAKAKKLKLFILKLGNSKFKFV